ncbi:hypothetical protein A1O3_00153 [Capronia epimyces CBS 606.96]|uniref:Uncharacterized protein n=1 Tax=Capronia epimyces CBS 606.96 TaxID=1182542 RepID=W9YPK3_9EURO|nr:uncharacterized protein A1O3_00153 [Capronia epimyces CBS 606.96]EXJ91605.1 hypothetical protein A1O3_00153 [Capronia epimyces CBS 606.96]
MCQHFLWNCGHTTQKTCPSPNYEIANMNNAPVQGLKCPGQPVDYIRVEDPCYNCILKNTGGEGNIKDRDLARAYGQVYGARKGKHGQGSYESYQMPQSPASNPYLRRGAIDLGQRSNLGDLVQESTNLKHGSLDKFLDGSIADSDSSHPGDAVVTFNSPSMARASCPGSRLYPCHPSAGPDGPTACVSFSSGYSLSTRASISSDTGLAAGAMAGYTFSPRATGFSHGASTISSPCHPGIIGQNKAGDSGYFGTPTKFGVTGNSPEMSGHVKQNNQAGTIGDKRQAYVFGQVEYSPSVPSNRS